MEYNEILKEYIADSNKIMIGKLHSGVEGGEGLRNLYIYIFNADTYY